MVLGITGTCDILVKFTSLNKISENFYSRYKKRQEQGTMVEEKNLINEDFIWVHIPTNQKRK